MNGPQRPPPGAETEQRGTRKHSSSPPGPFEMADRIAARSVKARSRLDAAIAELDSRGADLKKATETMARSRMQRDASDKARASLAAAPAGRRNYSIDEELRAASEELTRAGQFIIEQIESTAKTGEVSHWRDLLHTYVPGVLEFLRTLGTRTPEGRRDAVASMWEAIESLKRYQGHE